MIRASGGGFGQDTGVTPPLFTRSVMGFLMTRESGPRFNVSSERLIFLIHKGSFLAKEGSSDYKRVGKR